MNRLFAAVAISALAVSMAAQAQEPAAPAKPAVTAPAKAAATSHGRSHRPHLRATQIASTRPQAAPAGAGTTKATTPAVPNPGAVAPPAGK